ncbi:hypothetical protein HH303_00700 [Rhodospirillaceae bacterium KN72]|uniref:Ferric reductase n=1 Tax=Pacificispira spongiicola TaxID=2729598 RepID=A0A7Y0DY64_9PROT|nr:EF-hand domain-containing protein [Pacificispira spongiicola]NMM42976.1 hypothetical protein [Pacificispira spongiicola]
MNVDDVEYPKKRPGQGAMTHLHDIEARFKEIAGDDDRIDVGELQRGLDLHDADYAARVFRLIDEDKSGEISLWEFIRFARVLVEGTPEEKLRIIFNLHDLNGDGTVDFEELTHILDRSLNEHSIDVPPEKVAQLGRVLFASIDTDGSGSIDFEEFQASIDAHPSLKAQMIDRSSTWLRLPERIASDRRRRGRSFRALFGGLRRAWENERPWLILLTVTGAALIWLFERGMVREAAIGSDLPTQIAQGAAEAVKLCGVLMIVSMLRHSFTLLRRFGIARILPVDRMIDYHRVVGHTLAFLALVHVVGYIVTYESLIDPDFFTRDVVYGELFRSQVGWSGVTLATILLLIWAFARESVRRSGMFEAFYLTHRLFWAFLPLLIVHVPGFAAWIAVPGAIFLMEQGHRLIRGRKPSEIDDITPMPSNVTRLRMKRPDWLDFKPGEYVQLRIPAVSKREWHPFTVTSSPDEKDCLELHVRSVGNWTRKLNELAMRDEAARAENWRRVYLEGPYGSPSSDINDCPVPVLIGAGIGVTPFASILKTVLERSKSGNPPGEDLQRLYFIWLNRDQKAFEWFGALMAALEDLPELKGRIDIRVWLTGLKAELTSASLTVAMEVYHEAAGRDLLTGLRTRTELSRPNWNTIFSEIKARHEGAPIDVFYCGPEGLSTVLSQECARFGFGYRKENF